MSTERELISALKVQGVSINEDYEITEDMSSVIEREMSMRIICQEIFSKSILDTTDPNIIQAINKLFGDIKYGNKFLKIYDISAGEEYNSLVIGINDINSGDAGRYLGEVTIKADSENLRRLGYGEQNIEEYQNRFKNVFEYIQGQEVAQEYTWSRV